ncbi:hypothetical protein THRCLA_21288 [Thraustotheca clavata]|uniref:Uncharacterized protein n=1 Tax=Thraustotheca clavata TaxID=74557 RepID=A0A1V9ZY45_9STRA|nr:hypothetical protein THRCLA_21288 [Thraustotheca clavata]
MPPKRKATTSPRSEKRSKKSADNNSNEARKAKAKTMKARILYLVSVATGLLSGAAIKKLLVSEFGNKESKKFNSNVNEILKDLVEEERDDFGKIKGKYYGGESTPAFKKHCDQISQEEKIQKLKDEGLIECCFCEHLCDEDCFVDEDSVARGGEYRCSKCKKTFWTWISTGYTQAHPIEYRYGDGEEDYKDLSD